MTYFGNTEEADNLHLSQSQLGTAHEDDNNNNKDGDDDDDADHDHDYDHGDHDHDIDHDDPIQAGGKEADNLNLPSGQLISRTIAQVFKIPFVSIHLG